MVRRVDARNSYRVFQEKYKYLGVAYNAVARAATRARSILRSPWVSYGLALTSQRFPLPFLPLPFALLAVVLAAACFFLFLLRLLSKQLLGRRKRLGLGHL